MFIKQVSSYCIDRYGRCIKRTTNFGKFKDTSIAIESDSYKGTVLSKQIVAWTDTWQKIVNKVRNKDGKFERIG